jgi:hypothetical protein
VRKRLIATIDEYDLNHDGMADVTIILRNGEKGIYISFRALAMLATTVVAASSGLLSTIL